MLISPVLTEKSNMVANSLGQYVFKVRPQATKAMIRSAIEELYEVNVASVTTLNVRPTKRRTMRGFVRTKRWKKAYVSLAQGQSIDIQGA